MTIHDHTEIARHAGGIAMFCCLLSSMYVMWKVR